MAFNSLMHPRNIYKNRPDFAKIALDIPEFRKYVLPDSKGKVRVDFNNPDALRMLTKILLKKDFNLSVEIPKGFLIPTVPQRLNYILWVEDLITVLSTTNETPYGIDIGCGPCAIFSLLGAKKNGWKFVATESSEESLQWAMNNINTNSLNALINVVKVNSDGTLDELLSSNKDIYDFCLCNPPFFDNIDEIKKKNTKAKETIAAIAKQEEIIAEGGEVGFVKRIINESFVFRDRIRLYTSMFGKKKSFVEIWKTLQNIKDISLAKSQFCQGNTIRWGIAWTFLKSVSFDKLEKPNPKKARKPKPPLVHQVPKSIEGVDYNVQALSKVIFKILKELEIIVKVVRSHEHYIECLITSNKNTWSHQRRKRREMSRNVETTNPCAQTLTSCSSKDRGFENVSIQGETVSSLLPLQYKCIENCVISTVDCDVKLESEIKKRKLSELDSPKKFCSDLDPVKSGEHSFLKSNDEFETNFISHKSEECLDTSKINCKDLHLRHSPLKSDENLIVCQTSAKSNENKHESEEVNSVDNCNISSTELNTEFKNRSEKRKLHEAQFDSHKKLCTDSGAKNLSETQLRSNNGLEINLKEHELSEKNYDSFKTQRKDLDFSEILPILPNRESKEKHVTKQSGNCPKYSEFSSSLTREQKKFVPNLIDEMMNVNASEYNNCKQQTVSKKVSNQIMKKKVVLNEYESLIDTQFEAKSLLFCTLKIRKAKEFVLIEMNCPLEANRETMHQIFQYLKNKVQGCV